jgi:hypothetical protein
MRMIMVWSRWRRRFGAEASLAVEHQLADAFTSARVGLSLTVFAPPARVRGCSLRAAPSAPRATSVDRGIAVPENGVCRARLGRLATVRAFAHLVPQTQREHPEYRGTPTEVITVLAIEGLGVAPRLRRRVVGGHEGSRVARGRLVSRAEDGPCGGARAGRRGRWARG